MRLPPLPRIVIDSREQRGYKFDGLATVVKKLDAGDYALEGYESECAVERKSKQDAYGCVGSGRARFEESLRRLSRVQRPGLVIECGLIDFCSPPPRTRIVAAQCVGSYISWCCEYRIIGPWWADSPAYGERLVLRFLSAYWRHLNRPSTSAPTSGICGMTG